MTPIRRPRTLRRIATALLLCWVFALGASWANACLLQDRQTHAHATAAGGDAAVPSVTAGHAGAVPSHGHDAGAGDLACLDLCDAAAQSCTQKDAAPDVFGVADLPPPLHSIAWALAATRQPDTALAMASPPQEAAVPLRTRFSRLAL